MAEGAPGDLNATTYDELRRTARTHLARLRPGQTMQATALVHEAWLRLEQRGDTQPSPEDRRHFFFTIGRAMRDLLVEEARRRGAAKRGGGAGHQGVTGLVAPQSDETLLAVHDALGELEAERPELAELVSLRFFAGLTVPETALALGTSESSVARRWRFCRAWLLRRIGEVPAAD